jgi:hypothetical protein
VSKLNWEKQNKAELPKLKRRESQRTKVLKAYENGAKRERERIIKLLEEVLQFDSEDEKRNLFALIKGEQK